MNRTLSRFERTMFGVLTLVSAALFLYLFGYSLLRTAVFDPADLPSEHVIYVADQVLWGLLGMGGLTLLCRLLLRFEKRICLKAFTTVCLSLTFILGCAWVLLARAVPINDTGILYYTAAELSRGNVAELWRHETYLRAYPHQAGFLQYSEALQRLLGRGCNLPMGLLNAVYLTGACGALLMLTWQSLHDRRVQLVTALLLTLFVQPLLYTTFLYGNLPGLCLALWAVVCVQRVVQGGSRWYGAVACALMAAAVILKPNYLIFALAAALVLGVYAIGARRWGSLMLAMLLLVAPAVGGRAAQWVLQKRTGFELGSGAPQTTWLAMGMQEGPRAPGWYNRYTLDLMDKTGGTPALMRAQIRGDIAQRMAVFRADPAYAARFYHQKVVSQWAETTFESQWINRVMPSESRCPQAVRAVLESRELALYMESFTLLMYLSFGVSAAWLVVRLLGKGRCAWTDLIAPFVLLTTLMGGFLYHMLFEGKSQYVLIYVFMMAPFAAFGLSRPVTRRAP